MGALVSAVKEEAAHESVEAEKQANDALNALMELADTKLDLFYSSIVAGNVDTSQIAIDKVVTNRSLTRVGVTSDAGPIKEVLHNLIGSFISGDIAEGIEAAAGIALDAVFGNYAANSSTSRNYTIGVSALGAIYRIDYLIYSYQFTSATLIKVGKNVLAVQIVVSSARIHDLSANTLRTLVELNFPSLPLEKKQKIYDQLAAAVKDTMSAQGLEAPFLEEDEKHHRDMIEGPRASRS